MTADAALADRVAALEVRTRALFRLMEMAAREARQPTPPSPSCSRPGTCRW
ncbi:MAG: hypothetical protein ACLQDY_15665 [Streptosporangiaceae bacterium]